MAWHERQAITACVMAFDTSLLCIFFNPTVKLSGVASGKKACLFCTIDCDGDGVSVEKRQELCEGRTIGGWRKKRQGQKRGVAWRRPKIDRAK